MDQLPLFKENQECFFDGGNGKSSSLSVLKIENILTLQSTSIIFHFHHYDADKKVLSGTYEKFGVKNRIVLNWNAKSGVFEGIPEGFASIKTWRIFSKTI